MYEGNKKCVVLQPVKKKFEKNDIDNVLPHQHHETHKAFDLIIAKLVKDRGR